MYHSGVVGATGGVHAMAAQGWVEDFLSPREIHRAPSALHHGQPSFCIDDEDLVEQSISGRRGERMGNRRLHLRLSEVRLQASKQTERVCCSRVALIEPRHTGGIFVFC